MLEVKNILEDIVMKFLEEDELYKKGEITWNQKIEAASYVLNRMPPMYITSNRGFSNLLTKYENDPQFLADVMVQIEDALKVVQKGSGNEIELKLDPQTPYYVMPKIYGKLISSKTLLPIECCSLSLYVEGQLTKQVFQDWDNPCQIEAKDEGFFSFAPAPIKAVPPFENKNFQLKLVIEKNGQKEEKFVNYESHPTFIQNMELDFNENILQLEDIYVGFAE